MRPYYFNRRRNRRSRHSSADCWNFLCATLCCCLVSRAIRSSSRNRSRDPTYTRNTRGNANSSNRRSSTTSNTGSNDRNRNTDNRPGPIVGGSSSHTVVNHQSSAEDMESGRISHPHTTSYGYSDASGYPGDAYYLNQNDQYYRSSYANQVPVPFSDTTNVSSDNKPSHYPGPPSSVGQNSNNNHNLYPPSPQVQSGSIFPPPHSSSSYPDPPPLYHTDYSNSDLTPEGYPKNPPPYEEEDHKNDLYHDYHSAIPPVENNVTPSPIIHPVYSEYGPTSNSGNKSPVSFTADAPFIDTTNDNAIEKPSLSNTDPPTNTSTTYKPPSP